jgi:hypothetical protein
MVKTALLLIIIALRLAYQPTEAQRHPAPFSSQSSATSLPEGLSAAQFISVKAIRINNKIILNWIISKNQDAWCFEIEKCADGKNFKTAALVFGTDNDGTGKYEYFEKARKRNTMYRVKLLSKDNKQEYSSSVEINSNT